MLMCVFHMIDMTWFGCIFWHINLCALFNTKSYIYVCVILAEQFVSNFLKKLDLICLHTV